MKTISRYIMTLALLITAATGAWAEDTYTITFAANNKTVTKENVTLPKTFSCNFDNVTGRGTDELDLIIQELYGLSEGCCGTSAPNSDNASVTCNVDKANNQYIIVSAPFNGTATVTGRYVDSNFKEFDYTLEISFPGYVAPFEITTNAASEGATFTEAWFNMPAFDATADYELVRDMSIQMTAQVGDGTQEQPRYRVKKDGNNKFIPADMEITAVPALFTVNDAIEQKALTQTQDYTVEIYAVDAQGQPTGEAMTFATFTFEPGIYAVKAVAATNEYYDGETALSNTFKLYDYINITFPKGYSTHYYNESMVLDEILNSLKFYAVTAVTSEKVTLTEIEGKAIPGGTPFIVYNETAEPITAVMGMLQADDVTSAEQFKGTAEDKSMGSQSNCYILRNGDSTPTFRLVEGAGTLPAHRCYIDLGVAAHTRSLGFDFGDGTTGIDSVESGELKVDSYYDLQGRKHQGTPQRKGVYVKDGRKVIVR